MDTEGPIVYLAVIARQPRVYKIGWTTSWSTRRYTLHFKYGPLTLVHAIATDDPRRLERVLHVRFHTHNCRYDGVGELFELFDEQVAAVKLIRNVHFLRPRTLSTALREWRRARRWSRRIAAQAARLPESTILQIENGNTRGFSAKVVVQIAGLLGVPPLTLV